MDVVTAAIGQDSRIGKKIPQGATGYGGPCFPRDNVAFGVLAQSLGATAAIAEATDVINRKQAARIVTHLLPHLKPNSKVAILGLAYKPDTNVIEESQGVALAQELLSKGFSVILYDPLALDNTRRVLGNEPEYANSLQECVRQADAIAITTSCKEFKELEPTDFASATSTPSKVVLDCWRVLDRDRFAKVCKYIALG